MFNSIEICLMLIEYMCSLETIDLFNLHFFNNEDKCYDIKFALKTMYLTSFLFILYSAFYNIFLSSFSTCFCYQNYYKKCFFISKNIHVQIYLHFLLKFC